MGDLVARLRSEGPQVWRQLSLVQRGSLIAVALATVVAIIFLSEWAHRTEFATVFTRLSESDAAAIVAKLKEEQIPYELTDGGKTVRVPSEMVHEVRLQLASQGLPKGGTVGFELFDKTNFGLTDFAQRLNFQRALEGELSRTIGSLSGVEDARVHIVMPQNELFIEREKPATASVVLRLAAGAELDSRQIKGVVNLVARSVEGLKPESVTVLDGNGVMLSGGGDETLLSAAGTSVQREVQRNLERTVQRDIQAMLDQVLGPRKSAVRVSATLDWDQFESSSETYSPAGKPAQVRSSHDVVERSAIPLGDGSQYTPSYPLDGRTPAGPISPDVTPTVVPSPEATAVPSATATSLTVVDPKYERHETTNNYEISKLVERTVRAPGAVKRLSVSVLLDEQLDEGMVATISKSVTAAAGLDTARGDTVVVATLPFDQSVSAAQQQAREEAAQRELYTGVARGALVVLSILVVLLLVRSVIKGLTRDSRAVALPKDKGKRSLARSSQEAAMIAAPAPLKEEDPRPALIQREVTKLAQTEPKLVAQVVKSWLEERG